MMPGRNPSVAELRARAWQRLAAAVPKAIKVLTERKTKLEAQIDAGNTLSLREQRELGEIRSALDRHRNQQILMICALLSPMDLDQLQAAALRQLARKSSNGAHDN